MKKIPTLFVRNPDNMREILREVHPDCEWVSAGEGVATRKYDGTCCKIDADGYWKRREVKPGKADPEGFVLVQDDPNTGKRIGWVLVDPDSPSDRWHNEALRGFGFGTYELLGPKVQGNPEGIDTHELIGHAEAVQYPDAPRDYDGLLEWLDGRDIEGLVFHHPDGRMAKIKKRDFGLSRG